MCKEIDTVICDVDGTLTDGMYTITSSSDARNCVSKSFYTRDFYAIEQILRAGLQVVIITQSHDVVIDEQLRRICSHSEFWKDMCEQGRLILWTAVDNKVNLIEDMLQSGVRSWDNIAYIGDAENDYDCIKLAGFSGCPTDAVPYVRDKAMYPSDYRGGHGAVHDFCMYLLEQRNKEDKETEDENS